MPPLHETSPNIGPPESTVMSKKRTHDEFSEGEVVIEGPATKISPQDGTVNPPNRKYSGWFYVFEQAQN